MKKSVALFLSVLMIFTSVITGYALGDSSYAEEKNTSSEPFVENQVDDIEISIDKTLISVDEDTEITVYLSVYGEPLAYEEIEIGDYASGQTDGNGRFTTTISPSRHDAINIEVMGRDYEGLLFAIEEDEGVVEVRAKDVNGDSIDEFSINTRNDIMEWDSSTESYVGRSIAKLGTNLLVLTSWSSDEEESYYLTKNIYVTPSEINTIEIDGSASIKVDTSFSYNDVPIEYGEIFLEKMDESYDNLNMYLGETKSIGEREIYASPGYYNFSIKGYTRDNELFYVTEEDIYLNSDISLSLGWDKDDTGEFILGISIDDIDDVKVVEREIEFGNKHYSLGDNDFMLMTEGDYELQSVGLVVYSVYGDSGSTHYNYKFDSGDEENITIITGQVSNHYFNLDLDEIYLDIDTDEISLGEEVEFELIAQTESGLLIDSIEDYEYMDVSLEKPNGTTVYLGRQEPGEGSITLEENDPQGTYRVKAEIDLGPIYGKHITVEEFDVYERPEVTVNKTIVNIGEVTEVVVSVTSDGQPLENCEVDVDGYDHGFTDSNGEFVSTIYSDETDDIEIEANGYGFKGMIFILEEDEGVVEATVADKDGIPLDNVYMGAFSDELSWHSESDNDVYSVRAVVKQGINSILVSNKSHDEDAAYYMVSVADVQSGQINKIHFDGSDTVAIEGEFQYESETLSEAKIYLQGIAFENGGFKSEYESNYSSYMGITDEHGEKTLRVTPGIYNVRVSTDDFNGKALYLIEENLDMISSSSVTFNWDSSDTGKMLIDFITGEDEYNKFIKLDNMYINIGENEILELNTGSYRVDKIGFEINDDDEWIEHSYEKDWDDREVVNITSGNTVDFTKDLRIQEVYMDIENDDVEFGKDIDFQIVAETNSDYLIGNIDDYDEMDVIITKPSGVREYFYGVYIRESSYYLEEDAESGRYWISGSVDFGPLYGDYTVGDGFYAGKAYDVSVNNMIIETNKSTNVTVEVTNNGIPQAGARVHIEGFASGSTDGNGEFTVQIEPSDSNEINVIVNDKVYEGLLFAVNSDEGVVEISGSDINGNLFEQINFDVFSEAMARGGETDEGISVARRIAKEGPNKIMFAKRGYDGETAYYMIGDINVEPGEINTYHFDGSNTVEIDMTFDGLSNIGIRVEGMNFDDGTQNPKFVDYYSTGMGETDDNGYFPIRVSPGVYDLRFDIDEEDDDQNEMLLHFIRKELDWTYNQNIDFYFEEMRFNQAIQSEDLEINDLLAVKEDDTIEFIVKYNTQVTRNVNDGLLPEGSTMSFIVDIEQIRGLIGEDIIDGVDGEL